MVQEYFERLHKVLLETEGLSNVSDDMRELVEEEWPELVHKGLPPQNNTLVRSTASSRHATQIQLCQAHCALARPLHRKRTMH